MVIRDIDDVREWAARMEATSEARWNENWRWKQTVDVRYAKLETKIEAMERRVTYLAGFAAAIGAIGGTAIPDIIESLRKAL